MTSYYSYQNSLAKYNDLLDAYKTTKANQLSTNQLKDLNQQMQQQEKQSIGLGAGLPISMTVATSFLKTKGSKALLGKLGKKLGMDDEDIEALISKDPKQAMADLVEKYGSKKINKLLGRKTPAEPEEEAGDVAEEAGDVADEPLDTEAFNVEFPSLEEGGLRMTNRMGDLLETPMRQRPPVDTDEFFDAEEEFGDEAGDLMETSFPSISHEVVTLPQQTGTQMTDISADVGATTAEETSTAVATAGEVGEDVALTSEVLEATPLAPLGLALGAIGAILSFLPFMKSGHHRPPPPPLPKNLTIPSAQFGV